ncbi:VOC family protein [Qipengyuania sp. YG27]|uniref:VOC family protein n=1 Tax=Qipengyuania mesophila TaxID=2867246 RepID=A0ABS7JW68_9SPHN|nr:VOC family protein [Qipengyuania mesophila]MBX7501824.1 VOC family protein [Qipengyuania mesophila]
MSQMIFVNLPVADLARSKAFYEAIGFTNEPKFTDETAAGMMLSEAIHVMLLTHDKWKGFTSKAIPDAKKSAQMMLCLSRESREAVDAIIADVAEAGGNTDCDPPQDYGFMYGRSFEDPDGHNWEVMWMDPVAVEKGPEAFMEAAAE